MSEDEIKIKINKFIPYFVFCFGFFMIVLGLGIREDYFLILVVSLIMGLIFAFIFYLIFQKPERLELGEEEIEDSEKDIREMEIEYEIINMGDRRRKREIREEAERRLYGKSSDKKRISLTTEEKEMIFDKFNNKCAICNTEEGLHIHHKDQNPQNNRLDNLLVLCGVCHKKVHMKVR